MMYDNMYCRDCAKVSIYYVHSPELWDGYWIRLEEDRGGEHIDRWCDTMLRYDTDTSDALIGIFGSCEEWSIGALASGIIKSAVAVVNSRTVYQIYDTVNHIADRTIDAKYITIND